jgi:hypothetical protein
MRARLAAKTLSKLAENVRATPNSPHTGDSCARTYSRTGFQPIEVGCCAAVTSPVEEGNKITAIEIFNKVEPNILLMLPTPSYKKQFLDDRQAYLSIIRFFQ